MSTPISYRLNTVQAIDLRPGDAFIFLGKELYVAVEDTRLPNLQRITPRVYARRIGFFATSGEMRFVMQPSEATPFVYDTTVEQFTLSRAEAQR